MNSVNKGIKEMDSFNMEKAQHEKAEKRLKASVAAKPFNLSIIKNPNNVRMDDEEHGSRKAPRSSRGRN